MNIHCFAMFLFLPFLMLPMVFLAIWVLIIIGFWKTFEKAGQPGWGSIIPIFNLYCLVKIAGKPGWWTFLLFIPLVNLVIWIILALEIARLFGKGTGFAFGLAFLSAIFYLILGFGSAVYRVGPPPVPGALPA